MTQGGRDAVRKAFENTSGLGWDALRDEFISLRLSQMYQPFRVEDFRAGGPALEFMQRAYHQGLREADQAPGDTRAARAERERRADAYTAHMINLFDREVSADWITDTEHDYVRGSIRAAYLAGCDEGRLPIGSVM